MTKQTSIEARFKAWDFGRIASAGGQQSRNPDAHESFSLWLKARQEFADTCRHAWLQGFDQEQRERREKGLPTA